MTVVWAKLRTEVADGVETEVRAEEASVGQMSQSKKGKVK